MASDQVQAHRGFIYERNAIEALKGYGIVPKDVQPAGAASNKPDIELMKKNNRSFIRRGQDTAGCELKMVLASAGSLVLKYDPTRPKGQKWGFDPKAVNYPEKKFLMDLAESAGMLAAVNKQWTEVPYKRPRDTEWKNTVGKLPVRDRYERDLAVFKRINLKIEPQDIEKYYNLKDSYYINIGTHGFFLLGARNPLKLKNDVQQFNKAANRVMCVARVQYKGGGQYQFVFEMMFSMKQRSKYNIAPTSGDSPNIQKDKINIDCFYE